MNIGMGSAKTINNEELSEIMTTSELCKHFFLNERIVVDCVPYRLHATNSALILNPHINTSCVATGLPLSSKSILTFNTSYMAPVGIVCNFETYGVIGNNLKANIYKQLQNVLSKSTSEYILLCCFCASGVSQDFIHQTWGSFGFVPVTGLGNAMLYAETEL